MFLISSLRVTMVSALPIKPNRQSIETRPTSTTSWNVWKASTVMAGLGAAAAGHGTRESSHERLYVVMLVTW